MGYGSLRSRTSRFILSIGAPAALAALSFRRPNDYTADVYALLLPLADDWMGINAAWIILCWLLAMGIRHLIKGRVGWLAASARAATWIYAVATAALYSVSGLALGALIRHARWLEKDQQTLVASLVQKLYFDPLVGGYVSLLSLVTLISWMVAVLGAAGVLYQKGASVMGVGLLIPAAVFFGISPAPPFAPLGMIFFILAAVILEWRHRQSRREPPPLSD